MTVMLRQKAEYMEETVVGFSLDGSANYQVRIPVLPQVPVLELQDPRPGSKCCPEIASAWWSSCRASRRR